MLINIRPLLVFIILTQITTNVKFQSFLRKNGDHKTKIISDHKNGVTKIFSEIKRRNLSADSTIYDYSIQASDSILIYGYPFLYATFNQPVYFDDAKFISDGDFGNSIFRKKASFRYANFNKESDFFYVKFQWADFSYASFMRDASFNCANFEEEGSFDKTNFEGVIFRGSVFKKNA